MPKKSEQLKKDEPKKVAIYCRVSTHDQGRGDFSSLKSQEEILRRYCQAPERNWTVYDVYADTKTGTEIYDSLELAQKRRFNQALFVEIRSFLKRGENNGELHVKIRADGTLKYKWQEVVNQTVASSQLKEVWLRRQDSNPDFIGITAGCL